MERKKNEDEEEGQEKMYTLVKLAPMFKSEWKNAGKNDKSSNISI